PPSISQLPSFFLRSDFHHRSLHSFPTRRSSDLLTPAGAEGAACSVLCSCPGPSTRSPYVASRRLGQAASGLGISPAIWMIPENSDRKSTRLNSSHVKISYAVFCLKKKKYRANLC